MKPGDLSRRELLQAGAGLALAGYGLAGCTVERSVDRSAEGQIIKPEIDGDLLIYNWAQYMDPDIKKRFSEKYGVEVNEVNFDNLEAMVIKLRSGASYDVIWPSTEYVYRLNKEGLLAPFRPQPAAQQRQHLELLRQPLVGPQQRARRPLHLLHHRDRLARRRGRGMTGSWNDLLNPDGAGRMFILDDFQEAIGEANLINGFDLNTEDPDELEAAKQTLLGQKENARGFSTNSVQNLVSGSAVLHQAWNGDIVNVRNQVDKPELYHYETCKEGVPVGTDLMASRSRPAARARRCCSSTGSSSRRTRLRTSPGTVIRSHARAASRSSPSWSRTSLRSTSTWNRSPAAEWNTGSTIPRRASCGPRSSPRSRRGDAEPGDEAASVTAGGFWTRFLLPGGIWLLLLFAVPLILVLAISFGYVDDLGRAVYSTGSTTTRTRSTRPTSRSCCARSCTRRRRPCSALRSATRSPITSPATGGRYRNVLIALLVLPFFVNYLVRTYAWVALLADDGPGQLNRS